MSDVAVKVTHLRSLILSAVRYSLGRRTYIAQETAEIVMAHREALSPNDRIVILRDIREATSLGDGCDAREWLALASALEIDEKRASQRQSEEKT